jgi:hypothetical protein
MPAIMMLLDLKTLPSRFQYRLLAVSLRLDGHFQAKRSYNQKSKTRKARVGYHLNLNSVDVTAL